MGWSLSYTYYATPVIPTPRRYELLFFKVDPAFVPQDKGSRGFQGFVTADEILHAVIIGFLYGHLQQSGVFHQCLMASMEQSRDLAEAFSIEVCKYLKVMNLISSQVVMQCADFTLRFQAMCMIIVIVNSSMFMVLCLKSWKLNCCIISNLLIYIQICIH